MKAVAVLSLVSLLLLVPSAASQVSDDKLIVPGQRIGAWTLQRTVQEIVAALGPQTHITTSGRAYVVADVHQDVRLYRWEQVGLNAWTRDGQSILMLEAEGAPEFATEKGVRWGMSRADAEGAYGRPTRVTQWGPYPAMVTLQYNEIGLEVFLTQTSIVGGIGVFRPGDASSIWKP